MRETSKRFWLSPFYSFLISLSFTWSPFYSPTAKQVLAKYPLHLFFPDLCKILYQSTWPLSLPYRIPWSEGYSLSTLYNGTVSITPFYFSHSFLITIPIIRWSPRRQRLQFVTAQSLFQILLMQINETSLMHSYKPIPYGQEHYTIHIPTITLNNFVILKSCGYLSILSDFKNQLKFHVLYSQTTVCRTFSV